MLKSDIEQILEVHELFNAQVGISIYSIDKQKSLFQLNQDQNFVPASLIKVFTTFSSLFFLGEDYKFQTKIYKRGIIDDAGNLDGDLVIYSNGNPTIDYNYFDNADSIFYTWMKILDDTGINRVKGNIIIDQSYFSGFGRNRSWMLEDLVYDYAAEVTAVNLNQNSFIYNVRAENGKAKYELTPEIPNDFLESDVQAIKSINVKNIDEYYSTTKSKINVSGSIGNTRYDDYDEKYAFPNPNKYLGLALKEFLKNYDIEIDGDILIQQNPEALNYDRLEILDIFNSVSLDSIIKITNYESNNFIAEVLLKSISKEKTGNGDTDIGIKQINKLLDDIGVNTASINIDDGSGLSRKNLISPVATIKLLNYITKSEFSNAFVNSLPRPGYGTLKRRMKNTLAESSLTAKTGSMSGVSNIAGYVRTRDDELLCFAIFVNNFTAPSNAINNLQDLICMRLAAFTRKIDFLSTESETFNNFKENQKVENE